MQPFDVLFQSFGAGEGDRAAALFAASLIGVWIFFGHEACGDLAEEVKDASRQVPRAMILTMVAGGGSALLIALGMILAVPDMAAAVAGEVNPAEAALTAALGPIGAKAMLACLLLIVLSAAVSVIASTSRLLFSLGRDDLIVGSRLMAAIDERRGLPVPAVAVATLVPVGIVALGLLSPNAAAPIISFATAGIYSAFAMVVLGAVIARNGGWQPAGSFTLGRWGWPVTVAALAFETGAILNIVWPRPASADASFYATWLIPIALAAILGLGLLQSGRAARQGTQGAGA